MPTDFDIITDYGPDTDAEIQIKIALDDLRCRYQAEAEPLIKMLTDIHAMKMPKVFIVPKIEVMP